MNKPTLAIIIPCYNEQDIIKDTSLKLMYIINQLTNLNKISSESFLYLVDDGSTDESWCVIEDLNKNSPQKIKGLKLSRNFGNQNALIAGFNNVKKFNPDCILTIDADLQQDENSIGLFIERFSTGHDIVCGIRNNRNTDTIFKKYTALIFYRIMELMGAKIMENHSDYRLISKRALEALSEYNEVNLFLRGIISDIGFKTDYVYFDVKERTNGKSRFTYKKLFNLAINGITSFSIAPLRLVGVLGILMSLFSFGLGLEVLFEKYILKSTIPGWTTIVIAICFIGGIQIFSTGIIGEYLGQVYKETKARPRFIKDQELI